MEKVVDGIIESFNIKPPVNYASVLTMLESWDEAFSKTEEYRGGNANMHAVEAFLIVYDVTHDKKWLDRAIRVASVIIHDVARNNHYRVNEHFDTQWNPLPDYNKDTRRTASARSEVLRATGSNGAV